MVHPICVSDIGHDHLPFVVGAVRTAYIAIAIFFVVSPHPTLALYGMDKATEKH